MTMRVEMTPHRMFQPPNTTNFVNFMIQLKVPDKQNMEDLTDMGFNTLNYSPIHAIGNTAPQQPMGVRSGASIPTSMPRPQGGS